MSAHERPLTLSDVLEDALVQVDNLSNPEDVNYLLARLRAHAMTPSGRLEVAALLGQPEHFEVERAFVHTEGAPSPNSDGLIINLEHAAGIEPVDGDTVLVVVQRRWTS